MLGLLLFCSYILGYFSCLYFLWDNNRTNNKMSVKKAKQEKTGFGVSIACSLIWPLIFLIFVIIKTEYILENDRKHPLWAILNTPNRLNNWWLGIDD